MRKPVPEEKLQKKKPDANGPDRYRLCASILFYLMVLYILSNNPFMIKTVDFDRLKQIEAGNPEVLPPHGRPLELYRPFLPARGAVSWIRDLPHEAKDAGRLAHYHMAENYLAPLLINPQPEEPLAIVFCSNDLIAEKRLKETGYEWLIRLSPGQGIARKKE